MADTIHPMILNDDGGGQISSLEPPVSAEDLHAMVDKVAGTGVTTLCVALYDGRTGWHDSKLGTHLADVSGPIYAGPRFTRLTSICRSLREQGIDPLTVFAKRAREQGIRFIASLRMNDGHFAYYHGPKGEGPWHCNWTSEFWKQNQDLLLAGEYVYIQHLFDYAKEGTRAFRLAQIEEVCRNYDVDGFELDFVRHPHFFKTGESGRCADRMTDLVRNVRKMMNDVGAQKGKRLTLMAVVPRTIRGCELLGLDVRAWVRDRLVDAVVPKSFIDFDQHLPVAEWAALVDGHEVELYPCFEHGDTIQTFRAAAAKYYRDGATGLYFYNYWSFGLPYNPLGRQILTELADEAHLVDQDKHYALMGGGPCPMSAPFEEPEPPVTQVPRRLEPKGSLFFALDIADDVKAAAARGALRDVTLRVVTDRKAAKLAVWFNGQSLEPVANGNDDTVYDAVVAPLDVVNPGLSNLNTLRMEHAGNEPVTIRSAEVLVRYHGSRQPASGTRDDDIRDTRYPAEEGPWKTLACRCDSVPLKLDLQQWVDAVVKVTDVEALKTAATVRFEFRTPQTNAPDYRWKELYAMLPWGTDRYAIQVNGRNIDQVDYISVRRTGSEYWHWGISFDVRADSVKPGDNDVRLQLAERDPMIGWGLAFVHVDLFYKDD